MARYVLIFQTGTSSGNVQLPQVIDDHHGSANDADIEAVHATGDGLGFHDPVDGGFASCVPSAISQFFPRQKTNEKELSIVREWQCRKCLNVLPDLLNE